MQVGLASVQSRDNPKYTSQQWIERALEEFRNVHLPIIVFASPLILSRKAYRDVYPKYMFFVATPPNIMVSLRKSPLPNTPRLSWKPGPA